MQLMMVHNARSFCMQVLCVVIMIIIMVQKTSICLMLMLGEVIEIKIMVQKAYSNYISSINALI